MRRKTKFVAGLTLFYLLFALSVDLLWLFHSPYLPQLPASNVIAMMYRNYAPADHGYYDRPGQLELGLETINVCLTPLFYAWLLFALWKRKTYRYALQMAVGSWVAYSVCLDWWIAAAHGFPAMDARTPALLFEFFAASAPWLLGHLYFVFDAVNRIMPALRAAREQENRRPGPVRAVPSFEQARNARQRARASGLSPHYWYPVGRDRDIKESQVVETSFWREPIAIFRGADGKLGAIENRCAHRQLKLSLGQVHDCRLVCPYHGWSYDAGGRVDTIPHELFGRNQVRFKVKSYPVKVRYGLIFIFPGDPRRAEETPLPHIPELEGQSEWAKTIIDLTWDAHHSMILDNLSDLTHGYLHRDRQAFDDAVLVRHEARGDSVMCQYRIKLLQGPLMKHLLDRNHPGVDDLDLCFEYPYQWGNSGGTVKHYVFLLPLDERTTRVFFLFYFNHVKVPFTPFFFPPRLMQLLVSILTPLFIVPLVSQDGEAVRWEQLGYEKYFDEPLAEMHPAVPMFQNLVARKWEEHLQSTRRVKVESTQ